MSGSPWPSVPANKVALIEIGGTPSRNVPAYWAEGEDGQAWVSIADMTAQVIESTAERITDAGVRCSNVKPVPQGTPLMSFKLTVGRVAVAGRDLFTNEAIAAFHCYPNIATPRWLIHALPRAASRLVTDTAIKGSTLNKSKLRNLPLNLPPLPEQRRIAEILDTLDEAIRRTEQVIAKLRQIKQGLLNDLLTRGIDDHGELRPPPSEAPDLYKESELGWIPRGWEVDRIGSLCHLGRGRVISQGYLAAHPGPFPVYSSQSKTEGLFGSIDTFDFEGPHVTWTTDGAYAGTVFYREGRFNCTNVCGTLMAKNVGLDMHYLSYALAPATSRHVSRVGNDKLMNNVMAEIRVPLPMFNEQVRIVHQLEGHDDRVTEEKRILDKLGTLKQGLMDDLLTGRVRVRVPEEAGP